MKRIKTTTLIFTALPICALLCVGGFICIYHDCFTIEGLLQITPENAWVAALFFVFLFVLKSLSLVLPIDLLYVFGGLIFPFAEALTLSIVGTVLALCVPYWIARYVGGELDAVIVRKYPKLEKFMAFQQKKAFFFSFLLRLIGVLPCDIVSLYCGAVGLEWKCYVSGSLLGMLMEIIVCTTMGFYASRPGSAGFWLCVGVKGIMVVLCAVIFERRMKKYNAHTELNRQKQQ